MIDVRMDHVRAAFDVLGELDGPAGATPALRAAVIAGALARAEVGELAPGERVSVGAVIDVSGRLWQRGGDDRAELDAYARQAVRRKWSDQLHQQDLRPLTWPDVVVTGLSFRQVGRPWATDDLRTCDPERAELIRYSLECQAVPL